NINALGARGGGPGFCIFDVVVRMLEANVAARRDKRAQDRLRERDLFVGRPQPRPLSIQHGIDQIRVCQSLLDRLGASRTAKDSDDEEREYNKSPAMQPP